MTPRRSATSALATANVLLMSTSPFFSETMEDKVGGTFDERVGRTQLLSRCVFLRRRSQISSVTGGGGGGGWQLLTIADEGVSQMLTRGGGGVANADQC